MSIRWCIVTEEFSGVTSISGGIGACARGLATLFSTEGLQVDVLITGNQREHFDRNKVQEITGINELYLLSDEVKQNKSIETPVDAISAAYAVYSFLRGREYGVVHFNDWGGNGFYCAMARKEGLFGSAVVTHLHGSSEWVRRHNMQLPSLEDLEREAIEKSQIENSDLVVSPSKYLVDWYSSHGVKLPPAEVRNWILPQWMESSTSLDEPLRARQVDAGDIREFIFFGRHERRKGFEIFVDALALLPPSLQVPVTFLGRFDRIDREFTGSYVFRRLRDYKGSFRFINDYTQERAFALLRGANDALCVMPSLIENSPCVVGECLTANVPFLATAVGGTAELIEVQCQANCLSSPTAKGLANSLERVLTAGMSAVTSCLKISSIKEGWRGHVRDMISKTQDSPSHLASTSAGVAHSPLVTVCLVHHDRPRLLKKAIAALMNQTYSNTEIVLVDDGSRHQASHELLRRIESNAYPTPIRVIRSENRYLGAARNLAARQAQGEYLIFHDDDNLAEPQQIATFVRAAQISDFDILTAQAYVFHSEEEITIERRKILYFPIGIGGIFSFFRNRFGDANALIKRQAFEALGGFTELHGVGWEDWEFFLRAYLSGFRLGVVPEPLFYYRASMTGMLSTGTPIKNYERIFQLLDELRPRVGSELFRYVQANAISQQVLDRTWDTLSREVAGNIHQDLTAADPNSKEARRKLAELAFEIGRIEDATELALSDYEMRENLAVLLNTRRINKPAMRRKTVHRIEASGASSYVCIVGWLLDGQSEPTRFTKLFVDDSIYSVVGWKVVDRPDVRLALSLPPERQEVGFVALAEKVRRKGLRRPWGRSRRFSVGLNQSSGFSKVRVSADTANSLRGHIDSIVECSKNDFSIPVSWDGVLEIELPKPVEFGVIWPSGNFDFGENVSAHMKRFTSHQLRPIGTQLGVVIPSGLVAHVFVGEVLSKVEAP